MNNCCALSALFRRSVILGACIFSLALAACGSDGSGRYSPCEQANCGAPEPVTDVAALSILIEGLEIQYDGHYWAGCVGTSAQLEASQTMTIGLGERPAGDYPDCPDLPRRFHVDGTIPGISCKEVDAEVKGPEACRTIEIEAGTVFRLRAVIYDIHPYACNYSKLVEVLPSCDTPCPKPDLMCPTTRICYTSYDEFCRHCEAQTAGACACRDADGLFPDGTECSYFFGGDLATVGTCEAGVCGSKTSSP